MELARMPWTGVGAPVLVVPLGSCEQHGPHLPLDTDTVIATALARALVERHRGTALAPAISITASGEHHGFPGTLSIGTEALATVLIELVRSAGWAEGVVFVNGHGGNLDAVRSAERVLAAEERPVLAWWPRVDGGDLHAGRTETSLMLAIAPDRVDLAAAVDGPEPTPSDLVRHGVRAHSPTGVLGRATAADRAHGQRLLATLVDDLVTTVSGWLPTVDR